MTKLLTERGGFLLSTVLDISEALIAVVFRQSIQLMEKEETDSENSLKPLKIILLKY